MKVQTINRHVKPMMEKPIRNKQASMDLPKHHFGEKTH